MSQKLQEHEKEFIRKEKWKLTQDFNPQKKKKYDSFSELNFNNSKHYEPKRSNKELYESIGTHGFINNNKEYKKNHDLKLDPQILNNLKKD